MDDDFVVRATALTLVNAVRQSRKDLKPVRANVAQLTDFVRELVPALKAMSAEVVQLQARIKVLEARAGSGVTIISQGGMTVDAPGLDLVADAVTRLEATLAAPVVPVYGKDGKLLKAIREPNT